MTDMPSSTSHDAGTVAVLSRDLFFGMRIRTVLRQLGYTVALIKTEAEFAGALAGNAPGLVLGIVDFNILIEWDVLEPALTPAVPVIAFGAHTDVDGFRAAKRAGVARTVANGEFNRKLPDLARAHALPLSPRTDD